MNKLEKLEKKLEEKVKLNETETVEFLTSAIKVDSGDTDKILSEIQRNYRLTNNCNRREEKRLQYIEDKLNKVLEILKYKEVDTSEIKRQQEIEELENRLKELKGV